MSTQDPKYMISEFYEFKADRNLILESEKSGNGIFLTGILQKADTVNRNGRIYPYHILKRESEKYMELVNGNMAYGSTDHPDCCSFDTKILTKSGWKFLPDISEEEEILTFNTETKKIEIKKIDKKIDQAYQGVMYNIKGRTGIDQLVTPNHRFLIKDRNGKFFYKTAEELYIQKDPHWSIPKKGEWSGVDYEYITIPGLKEEEFKATSQDKFIKKFSEDIKIEAEVFYAFLGIYLAEGYATGSKGYDNVANNKYHIAVTQVKEDSKQKIRELLSKMPFDIRETDFNGKAQFFITDIRLHNYLIKLGNSYEKYIPEHIKQGSSKLLSILFEWFLMGDGRSVRKYYYKDDFETKKHSVFSTSEKLILDLQEILLKTGRHGNISTYQPKDRVIFDKKFIEIEIEYADGTLGLVKQEVKVKRLIKAENSKIQYNLNVSTTEGIYLSNDHSLVIEKIENYNGRVYCVRVENGNFYTMRNGKSHWTGNSAVVELMSVGHLIQDMWWENKNLLGRTLLLDDNPAGAILKGILKKGGVLGISSRGVGSVKNINGNDIVQDDFELIAFDFVSSPSTPGAYMFKEGVDRPKNGMTLISNDSIEQIKSEGNISKFRDLLKHLNDPFWKKV